MCDKSSTKKTIILLIADAWPAAMIRQLLDDGKLPNLKRYFVNRGLYLEKCISTFPSVSLISHTALLTGKFPALHGVKGHKWFDRIRKKSYSLIAGNSILLNSLLYDDAPTMHQIFGQHGYKTSSVFEPLSKGAHRHIPMFITKNYFAISLAATKLKKSRTSQFMAIWLPETDGLVHRFGSSSNEVRESIIETDQLIGQFMHKLKTLEILEESYVLLASDHGHTDVQNHFDLGQAVRELGCKVGDKFYHRWFERLMFRPLDAMVWTNGHGSGFIHILSQNRKKKDMRSKIVSRLIDHPAIELIIMKESNQTCSIISKNGLSEFELIGDPCQPSKAKFKYTVREQDPLGFRTDNAVSSFIESF